MEVQSNTVSSKKEVVVIQNLAEVDVNNSKALLLVDTQTFTIEYLDESEEDIEIKKSPSSRHSPAINQIIEPSVAEDGEVPHGSSSADCSICGKCYISVQSKKKHELSHFGIKLIHCEKCLKYFITSSKYYQHSCIINPRYYICHDCKRRYLNLTELQSHEIVHSKILPHRCENCKQCFPHLNSKRNHICHSYLPYSMYFCNKCFTAFKTYKGLIVHYLEHFMEELPLIDDISDSVILEYWQKFAIKEPNREKTFERFFKNKAEKRKIDNLYYDADDDTSFDSSTSKQKPNNITNLSSYIVHCRICRQAYKDKIEKLKHEIEHFTKSRPIKCKGCQKKFLLTSSFNDHNCNNDVKVEKICNICKDRPALSYLKAHELIHTGEAICKNSGKSLSECKCGCNKELLTKTLPCNLCRKTFHNMRYLDIHKLYHFIEDDGCEMPVIILQRLINDRYKVNDDPTLDFDTNRSDIGSDEATNMILSSDDSNESQEHILPVVQRAESPLNPLHYTKIMDNKNKEDPCQICNTKLNTVYDKKLHQLKHFGIIPYRCELCFKHFAQSAKYYSHKCEENILGPNSHPIKNAFNYRDKVIYGAFCHLCNKKFAGVNKLKRHETVHTNERPYKCTNCHKSFSQWTGRKKHTCNFKTINDTQKVECNKCKKVFRDIKYLSIHEIVHYFDEKNDLNDVPDFLPKKPNKQKLK